MNPDNIGVYMELLFKLITLVGLGIYVIYAAVVVRQEQLMAKVLEASSEQILKIIAWFHLGASIFVLLLAFIVL